MSTHVRSPRLRSRLLGFALPLALGLPLTANTTSAQDPCRRWAFDARTSCRQGALSDFWLSRAVCQNLPTAQERFDCAQDAMDDLVDSLEECGDVHEARLDVCDQLGGGIYHPVIDPGDFVAVIDNPYHPLLPGTTYLYRRVTPEETEEIVIAVSRDKREIMGVECTVVRATETVDGELEEDTFDWFAQDTSGNVWYFGELSFEFDGGVLQGLEGSWEAGVDGAKPGIVMKGAPAVGDFYRQEFLIGEAEDVGMVLSLTAPVSVPYGNFPDCLQTLDFSPLEPGDLEHKFYAPGVGLVLEVDLESGERTELISVQVN